MQQVNAWASLDIRRFKERAARLRDPRSWFHYLWLEHNGRLARHLAIDRWKAQKSLRRVGRLTMFGNNRPFKRAIMEHRRTNV